MISPTLTLEQQIREGKICPYCGGGSELIESKTIYAGRDYGLLYICTPCDAYVGVHKGTFTSKGRLANRVLREKKKDAHNWFDKVWKEGHMSRSNAYKWLSNELDIEPEFTHIGMFNEKECDRVVEVSMKYVKEQRKKAKTLNN